MTVYPPFLAIIADISRLSCLMSLNIFIYFLLVSATVGCIPTVSPDDDDIMSTATCGAECQPTITLVTSTTTSTTTTTTTTTCSAATCTCQSGGSFFENSCYLVIEDYRDSPGSSMECNVYVPGSTLCIITSPAENQFVRQFGLTCMGNCRLVIGGMRASATDPYIWPDGVSFADTWTNWYPPANPTSNPLQLCVHLDRNMVVADRWQSRRCDEEGYPCCEYAPTPIG